MFGLMRRLSLAVPLTLAVAVPYAMMSESTRSVRESLKSSFGSWFTAAETKSVPNGSGDPQLGPIAQWTVDAGTGSGRPKAGSIPLADLEGVLRFDITPRWVLEHWPYVATTREDGGLDGLRVPLLTGTRPHDVAGSLTYYFDPHHRVQRIALDGVVGDERHLVSVVTRLFPLQPQPAPGVSLFVANWNGKPTSALCVRRLPVVSADNPLRQFEFALELNRPNHYFGLSAEFRARLEHTQASQGTSGSPLR